MAELTIDELARRTGMTVRNVRSHQTRGLLPGPEVRGRVGYYGEEHVERLQLIQELQDDGLPLRLVERLLEDGTDAATRLLAMRRAMIQQPDEPGEIGTITPDELRERFPEMTDELVRRAMAIGALSPRADGSFGVPRPQLLEVAERVTSMGISLDAALRVGHAVQGYSEEAASTFVELVRDEVWTPYNEAGRPEEELPRIAATIEQLRPFAGEIFMLLLPPAIAAEAERVYGQELRGSMGSGRTPD